MQQENCTALYSLFTGQGFSCHLLFTSQLAAAIPGRPQKSPVLLSGKGAEYDFALRGGQETGKPNSASSWGTNPVSYGSIV